MAVMRHWMEAYASLVVVFVPNLVVYHWMVPNLVVYHCWVTINLVVQGHAVDCQGVVGGPDRRLGCSSYCVRSGNQLKNEEDFGLVE